MDDEFYEKKLKRFISINNIKAEHLVFEQSCHSVADAAKAVGTSEDSFIKSVVFVSGERTIVAIVPGDTRASSSRIMKQIGLKEIYIANPEQILERTGYPIGGVPPFGYQAEFLIDPKVTEKREIYGGGGSSRALVRVSPEEIVKANSASNTRIRK